jgi:peptide/nickel transport system permease protein
MAKFFVRRFFSLVITMVLVSMVIFAVAEILPGNVVRHILGQFATPAQEESYRNQLGLDRPLWKRYLSWLVGSDWLFASPKIGLPLRQTISKETGFAQWWAEEPDGTLIRWRLDDEDLIASRLQPDGSTTESVNNERWRIDREEEIERLTQVREDLVADTQLGADDREAILGQVDRLIQLLQDESLSQKELKAEIEGPEQRLEALSDPQAAEQRQILQVISGNLIQDEMMRTVTMVEEIAEGSGGLDEATADWIPGQLGRLATTVGKSRPELAETLREAANSLREGQVGAARTALGEAVGPLRDLIGPIINLTEALDNDDYLRAADVLDGMVDPSDPPDAAKMVILEGRLDTATGDLEEVLPELAQPLEEASTHLKEGDADAARAALSEAAGVLRERGPVIARTAAVDRAKVGRFFWGVDQGNRAVLWKTQTRETFWMKSKGAGWWVRQKGGAVEYIPLKSGLLRGDPGESLRTRQPVAAQLKTRLRNSAILAGIAFAVVMPLALVMGLVAGLNEGKLIDRVFSLFGLVTTSSPNFATGVFLILIFAIRLKVLPGATVFTSSTAIFSSPKMLVLPVATLTLIELGYVLRITRASMVEVMDSQYIRTAILKGVSYWNIIFRHALRNALMAPITVIMLHVNWLLGGIVVVEAIFGYPGLGTYILTSALYKDVFAIEAAAMVMVVLAVGTQLIADVIYTFLNPRIRYA